MKWARFGNRPYLHAIADQVDKDLPQPIGIVQYSARNLVIELKIKLNIFHFRLDLEQLQCVQDALFNFEFLKPCGKFTGVDLG